MEKPFYQLDKIYKHIATGYTAQYIGKGFRNRHVYKVIEPLESGFKAGDEFYVNEPDKYFTILD